MRLSLSLGLAVLSAAALSACDNASYDADHQEAAEVLVAERGGADAPSFFDDAVNDGADRPGACAAMTRYDVRASADADGVGEATVFLENRCADAPLMVYRIELLDLDDAFELLTVPPTRLAPGDAAAIRIGYDARGHAPHLGEILIVTDDTTQIVSLLGEHH